MTDPANDQNALKEEDVANFSWWLTMLPFAVVVCVCVYKWLMDRTDMHWLLYALGALLIGLVFAAVVNSASGSAAGAEGGTTAGGTDSNKTS